MLRMLTNDELRAMYREGQFINAIKAIRLDGSTYKEAKAKLDAMLTDDDRAAYKLVQDARSMRADPWVETAPGIYEPLAQVERMKREGRQ
jgi:hypothetical protein